MLVLASEGQDHLRVLVGRQVHHAGTLGVGDEQHGGVVALGEAEALDVVGLGGVVPVDDRVNAARVQLLNAHHVSLVLVHEVVRCGVVAAVGEDGQNLVFSGELAQMLSAALFVEALDIGIVPDVLALQGGDTLGLELDLGNGVLGNQVTARAASLDGQACKIPFQLGLFETLLGPKIDSHRLGLSVVVHGEPEDSGFRGAGGDVVLLVAGYGGDIKALGVVGRALAFAVDDVVDGSFVASVEHAGVEKVLTKEGLVAHLGYTVLAVAANHDNLAEVGAVSHELSAFVTLEADTHEAFGQVGVELGVVGYHLGDGDVLQGGDFREAGPVFSVLLLEVAEPLDGVLGDVLQLVLDVLHLVFQGVDLLVQGLGVELGDLADGLLHQSGDVFHHNLAAQEILVLLHLGEDVFQLFFPGLLVLLQHLIDAVLKEDALQGAVVPVVLQFSQLDFQFGL